MDTGYKVAMNFSFDREGDAADRLYLVFCGLTKLSNRHDIRFEIYMYRFTILQEIHNAPALQLSFAGFSDRHID